MRMREFVLTHVCARRLRLVADYKTSNLFHTPHSDALLKEGEKSRNYDLLATASGIKRHNEDNHPPCGGCGLCRSPRLFCTVRCNSSNACRITIVISWGIVITRLCMHVSLVAVVLNDVFKSLFFLFCSFNPDARIPVPFPGPGQHPHEQKDGTDWNFGVRPDGAHVKFEHTKGPTTFGGHVGVQRGSKPSWGVTFRHRF